MSSSRLEVTLPRKASRANGFRSPETPDPPRPPNKTSSPLSRVFQNRMRSPGPSRVVSDTMMNDSGISVGPGDRLEPPTTHQWQEMTSPNYDPSLRSTFYDQTFEQRDRLGSGSFATVFSARSLDDWKLYAIKRSRKFSSTGDRKRRLEEPLIARQIGEHPNLAKYYDAWEEEGELFIKMELCAGGSLKEYALVHDLPEDLLWSFFLDILLGLQHIHSRGYTHLDIKPANILVADHTTLKIGDFGSAVNHTADQAQEQNLDEGDAVYMAPELLSPNVRVEPSTDVFSAGMTMLDLVSGRELPGQGADWHMLRNSPIPGALFEGVSDDMANLIRSMLKADPRERPTVAQLLTHPKLARMARRRRAWRAVMWPLQTVAHVCRYVVALVVALCVTLVRAWSPSMMMAGSAAQPKHQPQHSSRSRRTHPTELDSPRLGHHGGGCGGGINDGVPMSEPVRTRLDFGDGAAADSEWGDRGRLLIRRVGAQPINRSRFGSAILFSDEES